MTGHIAVIGGGLMGAGIALAFAAKGYDVAVSEPFDAVRETILTRIQTNLRAIGQDPAFSSRVRVTTALSDAVSGASFVTEAGPEKLEVKRDIFRELINFAPADAILASNTSAIPITRIAQGLPTAHRIIGTHWWNPPYLVPLVEVIQAEQSSPAAIEAAMTLLAKIGKFPAHVRKDVPGFVGNRLQHAMWREAIAMVADGVCDAATLDACVKNSFGLRSAVIGPLENADLVGLDLTLDIHKTLIPELDRHDGPHEFLQERVAAGELGFKTGRGFRAWTAEQIQELRTRLSEHLVRAQRLRESP